jgi:hypothetical protein
VPLPDGLQAVTVTDLALLPDGTPDSGTARFTPSPARIVSASTGAIIDGTVTATYDADGRITVALLATDSTGISPTGWTYTVTRTLTGGGRDSYPISLPATAPAVDLADLTPVATSGGTPVTVGPTGPQGEQGPAGPAGPAGTNGANGADGWGTQAEYDTLAARVSAVESGFSTVNTYLTDLFNRVASLETRMTNAEARLTVLENP